jgi:hypothetical protein
MNHFSGNTTFCTAVTFGADIATFYSTQNASCWLKDHVNVYGQNVAYSAAAYLDNNGGSRK